MAFETRPRILSRPLRLHWAGWETDTFALQKAGWSLSAYQDIRGQRLQLAFRCGQRGGKMEAITEVIPFNYERMMDPYGDYGGDGRLLDGIVLRVQQAIGPEVMIYQTGRLDAPGWGPIDAEPRYTGATITRLEDFAHFASPLIRTNEIIVPEQSVPELLEMILKRQQPARTERIKEELRGENRPEQRFHAQIISLKDAA
jgi:hypothetical protein